MERKDLLRYQELTVMLKYAGKDSFTHTRTGYIYSVTMEKVVFWPLSEDEESIEIRIPFEDIKEVKTLIEY